MSVEPGPFGVHLVTDNVQDLTLESLTSIQAELAGFRAEANERFERLEESLRKQRRGSAGMLVMMQATAGDFDERVKDVEERVATLERRAQ